MSPTQLTLRYLREEGWECVVVETWNPHARIRQDLFGIIDILALRPNQTLGVQTTTDHNLLSRVKKVMESPSIAVLREAGWWIHCHGWAKVGNRWVLKRAVDCS